MTVIRILVVEDHPIYRDGLSAALSTDDIEVVGTADDVASALAEATRLRPDVILMDLDLGDTNGVDAIRELSARHPDQAVLVLTMHAAEASVFGALAAGARGYLLKGVAQPELLTAIRRVAAGEAMFGPGIAARVLERLREPVGNPSAEAAPTGVLTSREDEILDLMAEGWGNVDIAQRLFLSPKTVRNNVSNILGKLHAVSRGDAIVRARRWGYGRGPAAEENH